MNKQFVIAALLATTQAADCKDAYTNLADAELAAAKAAQAAAEGKVVKGEELVVAEGKNVDAMKLSWTPVNELVKPFVTHLDTAKAAYSGANTAFNDASDGSSTETIDLGTTDTLGLWNNSNVKMQFTAKKADLTTLKSARDTANQAVIDGNAALGVLKGTKDKQDAELVRRKAQEALYKTASEAATAAKADLATKTKRAAQWTASLLLTDDKVDTSQKITDLIATADYNELKKADLDLVASWKAADKAAIAKELLATDDYKLVTAAWLVVEGLAAQEEKKYTNDNVYLKGDVCDAGAGTCKLGDKVQEDKVSLTSATSGLTGKITLYNDAVTTYVPKYDTGVTFRQASAVKKLKAEAASKVASDAKDAAALVPAASDATSAGYYAEATKATANGQRDVDASAALITAKEAEIRRLENNKTVAQHIVDLAQDKFDNLQAVKEAASDKKALALAQQTLAQEALDRATTKLKVYLDQYDAAKAMKASTDKDLEDFKKEVVACKAKVETCTKKQAAALANCKGVRYKIAQEAYKEWDQQRTKNKETAAKVALEYAAASKEATDGGAGTRCEFPAKAADGTQKPRPKCLDEFCCGAANKYLRDGTRLTVETCQALKGTHTYKFFPKLKSGALAPPEPELWRFYCIEGAQKLAGALAAGLAAAYFMA